MVINNLNIGSELFPNKVDKDVFTKILDKLDYVKPVFINRDEFDSKSGEYLTETGENDFGKCYDLFLPIDLKVGEILEIIEFLRKKFNIEDYLKIDELLYKTKILVDIILELSDEDDFKKRSNFSDIFYEKIKAQKEIDSEDINKFRKEIKKIFIENEEKGDGIEKEKIAENILYEIFLKEFNKSFFKKSMNMIRFGMMTISKKEVEIIRNKNNNVNEKRVIREETIEEIDEKERFLRKKIGIDDYKRNLEIARESGDNNEINRLEIEASNKIIKTLYEYPYQFTEENHGFSPKKILESKEVYCVGFSLLGHAFLSELGIKHNSLDIYKHSALEIIINEENYYFDPTLSDKIYKFKYSDEEHDRIGIYKKVLFDNINIKNTIFAKSADSEDILYSKLINNLGTHNLSNRIKNKSELFKSLKMFELAIKFNPENSSAFTNLGYIYYSENNFKLAIEYYSKAINLNPKEKNAILGKGNCLFMNGKSKEAIELYKRAIELGVDDEMIYLKLGESQYEMGYYKKAIKSYIKALENDPENSIIYNNIGSLLIKIRKYDEAKKYCYKAIMIDSNYAEPFYNKGKILYKEGKYMLAKCAVDKFILEYNKKIMKDSTDIELYKKVLKGLKLLLKCYKKLKYKEETKSTKEKIKETKNKIEKLERKA